MIDNTNDNTDNMENIVSNNIAARNKFNNIEVIDEDIKENENLTNNDSNNNNNNNNNFNNEKNTEKNNLALSKTIMKIQYRIASVSSESENNPAFELLKSNTSQGWISARFCHFPQHIVIQFITPIILRQVNILSHENKIASQIDLSTYYPSSNEVYGISEFENLAFQSLGYITLDSNERTSFKAREYRKIYVNSHCLYLKLSIHKNHINRLNIFNQVGIISIECYGVITEFNYKEENISIKKLNSFSIKNSNKNAFAEEEMDDITQEKLRIYKEKLNEAIKVEDYDEANNLKQNIDKIRFLGKKLYELNNQKQVCIVNEDYDSAKIIKLEMDRLKSAVKNVEKGVPPLNINTNSSIKMANFGDNNDGNVNEMENSSSGEYNKQILNEKNYKVSNINNNNNNNSNNFNFNNTVNVKENAISGIPENTGLNYNNNNATQYNNNLGSRSFRESGFNPQKSNQFGETNTG